MRERMRNGRLGRAGKFSSRRRDEEETPEEENGEQEKEESEAEEEDEAGEADEEEEERPRRKEKAPRRPPPTAFRRRKPNVGRLCLLAGAGAFAAGFAAVAVCLGAAGAGGPVGAYNRTADNILALKPRAEELAEGGDAEAKKALTGEIAGHFADLESLAGRLPLTAKERKVHAGTLGAFQKMVASLAEGGEGADGGFDEFLRLRKQEEDTGLSAKLRKIGIKGYPEIYGMGGGGAARKAGEKEKEEFFKGVDQDFEKMKEDVHRKAREDFEKNLRYEPPPAASGAPGKGKKEVAP